MKTFPVRTALWIPAFAGMTSGGECGAQRMEEKLFYSVLKNDCYRYLIEASGYGSVFAGGVGKNHESRTATKSTDWQQSLFKALQQSWNQ